MTKEEIYSFARYIRDYGYRVKVLSKDEIEVSTYYDTCQCTYNCSESSYCPVIMGRDEEAWEVFDNLLSEPRILDGMVEWVYVDGENLVKSSYVYKVEELINEN